MAKSSCRATSTYGAQGELPRLPIPTLEETLDKFPKVLEALQTEAEQEETAAIVESFRSGDGPKLQALLEQYDEDGCQSGRVGSYVEEFWNDSYLAPDQSVVLNLNPFFVLQEGPDPKYSKDQIRRAASLTFASVKLASLLRQEDLSPDVHRGKPLCMDQFKVGSVVPQWLQEEQLNLFCRPCLGVVVYRMIPKIQLRCIQPALMWPYWRGTRYSTFRRFGQTDMWLWMRQISLIFSSQSRRMLRSSR